MARVRLTQTGYTEFTGTIGKVKFTNGVSADISNAMVASIGAVIKSVIVAADGATVVGAASPAAIMAAAPIVRVEEPVAPVVSGPQARTDIEPFYVKTIDSPAYTLTTADAGYLLDFTAGATVTVPANLSTDFYCSLRQGGSSRISVTAASGVTVEEIDGRLKSEKRLAILHLMRFKDGTFQLTGRTAA